MAKGYVAEGQGKPHNHTRHRHQTRDLLGGAASELRDKKREKAGCDGVGFMGHMERVHRENTSWQQWECVTLAASDGWVLVLSTGCWC